MLYTNYNWWTSFESWLQQTIFKDKQLGKSEHWLFHDVKKLSFWYDNDNMAMLFFKSDTHRKIYGWSNITSEVCFKIIGSE